MNVKKYASKQQRINFIIKYKYEKAFFTFGLAFRRTYI